MRLAGLLVATLLLLCPNLALAGGVGFQEVRVRVAGDKPLVVGIWYPSDAPAAPQRLGPADQVVALNGAVAGKRLPLVVMSHGTGGWYGSHVDTALELAEAGFVVASVSHTGDTYDDHSRAADVDIRPLQLKAAVDYMLSGWKDARHVDPERVGAFGFSSGGFTVLVAIGGIPDFSVERGHCQAHPTWFDCGIVRAAAPGDAERIVALPHTFWAGARDPRIKAAVIAAPALGFTFGRDGLKDVETPIQLWRAEDDHILPNPDYAEAVRLNLPKPPEYHVVANADHFDFLAPCDAALAKSVPQICRSAPGFDRVAFHADFDEKTIAFFKATLGSAR